MDDGVSKGTSATLPNSGATAFLGNSLDVDGDRLKERFPHAALNDNILPV